MLSVFTEFLSVTQRAMVAVFAVSEAEASRAVAELEGRFRSAPPDERDWLLHNDPVALAGILLSRPEDEIDQRRLQAFNQSRRESLEQPAV